jgi:Leucine-rich repeat (LRR) protein
MSVINNFPLANVPQVPLLNIFSEVSLNDLAKLSPVSKYFHVMTLENSLWRHIADKIHLPLEETTENNTPRNQVRNHILSLKKEIKDLKGQLPEDIAKIIESKSIPSYDEIQLLKDYRIARDIITVWSKLDLESAPVIAIKQPAQAMIDQANQFTNWFAQNINKFSSLIEIDLSDNQLSFLPSEIGQLTQLQDLNLDNNKLSTLPPEIGQLTQLRKLKLNDNKLSTLPSEIGQLTQLQDLHLYNNKLSIFPSEIGQLTQLQRLNLSCNNFSTLPPEIGQLTQLITLGLDKNKLSALPP